MKTLSQTLLERKRAKFIDRVRPRVAAAKRVEEMFAAFAYKPSEEATIQMFAAGKFGPSDPLSIGGEGFLLEYILDELDTQIASSEQARLNGHVIHQDPDGTFFRICGAQDEPWSNLVFVFDVDLKLHK